MKKHCGDYGTFEYRMPNIPEAMILLGEMGLNSKSVQDKKLLAENDLIYTARLIEKLEKFISKINLTINEKKVTKYVDVLNEFEMMKYLNEVAEEVFQCLNTDNKKKS